MISLYTGNKEVKTWGITSQSITHHITINRGVVDIRGFLEAGGSEKGAGMDTHGKPVNVQNGNETVPSRTVGVNYMQGEESGGVDCITSGEYPVE